MHPYELGRLMRERGKHHSIKLNYGSLYTIFEQLTQAELVQPVEVQRTGNRPERTVYALTEAGLGELTDWMRTLMRTPAKEYREFEAALSLLIVLPPSEVTDLLRQRLEALDEQIREARRELDGVLTEVEGIFVVEAEYRLVLLEAERAFVRSLMDRIERPTTGSC